MKFISANIVRFVDGHQPGWVECEFADAEGRLHVLRDKVPMFTVEILDADSRYPTMGKIPCEVLETFKDATGRELVRVSTEKPCGIDSAEGLAEFIVSPGLITDVSDKRH
jgi:hypothetical protein